MTTQMTAVNDAPSTELLVQENDQLKKLLDRHINLDVSRKLLARHIAKECETILLGRAHITGAIKDYTSTHMTDEPEHLLWMCRQVEERFADLTCTILHR